MGINGPFIAVKSESMAVFHQLQPVVYVAGAFHKDFQQTEFNRSQLDGFPFPAFLPAPQQMPVQIQFQVPGPEHRFGGHLLRTIGSIGPPEQGPDPCHQFPHAERFGHVVISSQFQSHQPVEFRITGGQHDDGNGTFLPDGPAYVPSIDFGQHQVEYQQLGLLLCEDPQGLLPVPGSKDRKLFVFEIIGQKIQQFRIVIHQQYRISFHMSLLAGNIIQEALLPAQQPGCSRRCRAVSVREHTQSDSAAKSAYFHICRSQN